MRERNVVVMVVIVVLALLMGRFLDPSFVQGTDGLPLRERAGVADPPPRRDFMFQIDGYRSENQGGHTLNMYFHYRYDTGIAEGAIPNYLDLRFDVLKFMNNVDTSQNPYWETLNKRLCTELARDYPIRGISCQLQVYPDYRRGPTFEPGFHTSIHTIGDIEPLAIPGPPKSKPD